MHAMETGIRKITLTLRNGAVADPGVSDRFLKNVEDETKRLSRLIDDLLDLGRLEAGVVLLEKLNIHLPGLIGRAVRTMETRMQNSHIFAQVNVAELQIQGDSERLLQAFINLLDNAIKHEAPNSQIFIAGYREGKQAVITIRDQGQGIKDSDLPRIFEQFYTGDRSRKGREVGLGLAMLASGSNHW